MHELARGINTVVEHLSYHPNDNGSSTAAVTETRREKVAKASALVVLVLTVALP